MASIKLSPSIALLLLAAACDRARPLAGEPGSTADAATACTTCHGDAGRSEPVPLLQAAPPADVNGASPGAHQAHLHAGAIAGPIACGECHVVPSSAGHSNGKVEVTFGALATRNGASPALTAGTCSGVYCHGATLGGGATSFSWTGGPLGCTSCHGHPPASHAPTSTDCSSCHPGTVKADGTIDVAGGLHVNGTVDLAGGGAGGHPAGWSDPAQHGHAANRDLASCRTCHGGDYAGGSTGVSCNACHGGTAWQANCTFCHGSRITAFTAADLPKAAPPLGTQGETLPADRAVGAHQAHLGSTLSAAVACTECHAVPTDLSHVDGAARVAFGTLARTGGVSPSWNGTSCSASYCHGSFPGGTTGAPVWTSTAALGCGACHQPQSGSSSASYSGHHYLHVASRGVACANCHGAGYSATGVNAATHVDGVKGVTFGGTWSGRTVSGTFSGGACSVSCHGSETW
jgi:predicted CxxxxCH...CXXCH cytochrome family protein